MTTEENLIKHTTRGVKLLQDGKPEEALQAFEIANRVLVAERKAIDAKLEAYDALIEANETRRQVIAAYAGLASLKSV